VCDGVMAEQNADRESICWGFSPLYLLVPDIRVLLRIMQRGPWLSDGMPVIHTVQQPHACGRELVAATCMCRRATAQHEHAFGWGDAELTRPPHLSTVVACDAPVDEWV